MLPDHLNAEIVAGTIQTTQEALDYMTWTYFFRRILQVSFFISFVIVYHIIIDKINFDLESKLLPTWRSWWEQHQYVSYFDCHQCSYDPRVIFMFNIRRRWKRYQNFFVLFSCSSSKPMYVSLKKSFSLQLLVGLLHIITFRTRLWSISVNRCRLTWRFRIFYK